MSEHLEYTWAFAMIHGAADLWIHTMNLHVHWRPVLLFSKGKFQPLEAMPDIFQTFRIEKDWHEWTVGPSGFGARLLLHWLRDLDPEEK